MDEECTASCGGKVQPVIPCAITELELVSHQVTVFALRFAFVTASVFALILPHASHIAYCTLAIYLEELHGFFFLSFFCALASNFYCTDLLAVPTLPRATAFRSVHRRGRADRRQAFS